MSEKKEHSPYTTIALRAWEKLLRKSYQYDRAKEELGQAVKKMPMEDMEYYVKISEEIRAKLKQDYEK